VAAKSNPVHAARMRSGLTLEEVAMLAGVSVGCVSRIERGLTVKPTRLTRRAIARALDVDESRLWPVRGQGTRTPSKARGSR
jgi:transcriptional regulator with XRE-family HTH domain